MAIPMKQHRFILDNGGEEELVVVAELNDSDHRDVAFLSTREGWTFEELKAEAALIVAAPDLLEACEAMQTQMMALLLFSDTYNLSPMIQATFTKCLTMAEQAIVKAQLE